MKQNQTSCKNKSTVTKVLDIIGIVLIVLMIPVLVIEMILLFSGWIHPDMPPSIMGYTPLVVTSGSMSPTFDVQDLIFVEQSTDISALEEGTIICYKYGSNLVTHRIAEVILEEETVLHYITQGDANSSPDADPVTPTQVVGVYRTHSKPLGAFVSFFMEHRWIANVVILLILLCFYTVERVRNRQLRKEYERYKTAANQAEETAI